MAVEAAVGVATHVVVVVAVVVVVVAVEYGESSCRGISSGGRCFESSGCSSCSVVVGLARAKIGLVWSVAILVAVGPVLIVGDVADATV